MTDDIDDGTCVWCGSPIDPANACGIVGTAITFDTMRCLNAYLDYRALSASLKHRSRTWTVTR